MGGNEVSPSIKPINKSAIHRICAGQVILDLPSAVKELVENSLDAGATSIEIALKDYGEESFQVVDNGCGISPDNFKVLALKHHTSKLTDFPDLESLTTFGFRGEALSSLSNLGDLTVETRTKSEQVATHLTFDQSGLLTEERKTARQVGTTVTVKKLFSNLPVRSKEFHRNIRKEYGKLISLLNAYALTAKGVRLVCTNTTRNNKSSVVLKTQGSGSLKDNIITVFGISTFTCLEPVSLFISDDCKVDGFLSKPAYGSGRSLGDRQYYFVNGRPVDMPKVSKLVNELYRSANSKQYPIAIMNFVVPTRFCDVNVTPDKRKIFFSDEGSILKSLKEALVKIYSPHLASFSVQRYEELSQEENDSKACSHKNKPFPQFSLKPVSPGDSDNERVVYGEKKLAKVSNSVNEGEEALRLSPAVKSNKDGDYSTSKRDFTLKFHGMKKADTFACGSPSYNSTMQRSITEGAGSPQSAGAVQSLLTKFVTVNKRKHESNSNALSEIPVLRNGPTLRQPVNKFFHLHSSAKSHIVVDDEADKIESKLSNHTTMDEHYDELDASPSKAIKISGQVEEDIMTMDKPAPIASSIRCFISQHNQ